MLLQRLQVQTNNGYMRTLFGFLQLHLEPQNFLSQLIDPYLLQLLAFFESVPLILNLSDFPLQPLIVLHYLHVLLPLELLSVIQLLVRRL